jgi:hypothetical protein
LTEGQDARLGQEKVDALEKAHAVAKQDRSSTLRVVVSELHADGQAQHSEQGQVETLYDHAYVNTSDCLQACGVSGAHVGFLSDPSMLPVQKTICALADELVNVKHALKGIKERLAEAKDSKAKLRNVRSRKDLPPQQVRHRQGEVQSIAEKLEAQKGHEEVELSKAQAAWDYEMFTLNTEHGMVAVKSKGGWRIGNPCLDLNAVPFTMLDKVLTYASQGIVRDNLVASLIPIERIVIEPLHLILNTGNACFDLSRNVLQFLLHPDRMPRRVNKQMAEGWASKVGGEATALLPSERICFGSAGAEYPQCEVSNHQVPWCTSNEAVQCPGQNVGCAGALPRRTCRTAPGRCRPNEGG